MAELNRRSSSKATAADWIDPAKGYTRYPNGTLEWMGGEVSGAKVHFKEKVFAIIARAAWGWDSPYAVKWKDRETGAEDALEQSDIAEKLKAKPSQVSRACAELEKEGRLLPNTGKLMYPSSDPRPLPDPPAPEPKKLTDLLTLGESKRLIRRFIPDYPIDAVTDSGNFCQAAAAIAAYRKASEEADAEFKRLRQVAEEEIKRRLWEIAKGTESKPGGATENGNLPAAEVNRSVNFSPKKVTNSGNFQPAYPYITEKKNTDIREKYSSSSEVRGTPLQKADEDCEGDSLGFSVRRAEAIRAPQLAALRLRSNGSGTEAARALVVSPAQQQAHDQPAAIEKAAPTYGDFKALYPRGKLDDARARAAFNNLTPLEKGFCFKGLMEHLTCERWVRSLADDHGMYIPLASNFIRRREYAADPPPYLPTKPTMERGPVAKKSMPVPVLPRKLTPEELKEESEYWAKFEKEHGIERQK